MIFFESGVIKSSFICIGVAGHDFTVAQELLTGNFSFLRGIVNRVCYLNLTGSHTPPTFAPRHLLLVTV